MQVSVLSGYDKLRSRRDRTSVENEYAERIRVAMQVSVIWGYMKLRTIDAGRSSDGRDRKIDENEFDE